MARKTARSQAELVLRQWCIEKALGWPTITHITHGYGGGSVAGVGGMVGQTTVSDADVIGRAEKIRAWVMGR